MSIRFHYQDGFGGFRLEPAYWDVFPLGCNYFENNYEIQSLDISAFVAGSLSTGPTAGNNNNNNNNDNNEDVDYSLFPFYFPNGLTGNVTGLEVDAAILCSDTGTNYYYTCICI